MVNVPHLKMNNGLTMPAFGLGTWLAKPGEVEAAVKAAIDIGYRHFDCALLYQNEAEIGSAIRDKINDGTVKREDLFIVSKLWNSFHKPELVVPGCKKTLKNFGLDYIDLYLIHWPIAFKPLEPGMLEDETTHSDWSLVLSDPRYHPRDTDGNLIFSDDDFVDTWKEMEKCVELGLTKSIGVSNFNSQQLARLLKTVKIKPVTNQVEAHPYLNQKKLSALCQQHGIIVTGYSPLTSPGRPNKPDEPSLLEDPRLLKIAQELNKTPAQVVFRYLVELGIVPIPKSTNFKRLQDNISVFDFQLSEEQRKTMDSFNRNQRTCWIVGTEKSKEYPFNLEY